jgi:hypothetical protein
MKLIYLTKEEELDYLLQNKIAFSKEVKFLTDSLILCEKLNKLKIKYINMWDYLTPDVILKNRIKANNIAKNFIDKKQKKQQLLLQGEAICPFEICLNTIYIFENILSKFNISNVSFFKNKKIPMIRTGPPPGVDSSESLSKSILSYIADKKNIQKNEIAFYNPRTFKINLNIVEYVKSKYYTIPLLKFSQKKNLIVLYQTGMHTEEVNFLSKYISKELNLKVIILSEHVLEVLKELSFFKEKEHVEKLIISNILKKKIPEIFDNKYLNFQFEAFEREYFNSVENSNIFEEVIKILNPNSLILGHDSFAKERAIIDVSKKINLRTISFIHGGISFKYTQFNNYGDSHMFALWNSIDLEWFLSFGIPKEKLMMLGSVRYENSFKDHLITSKKNFSITKKNRIVILTANASLGFSYICANPKSHLESLKEFISIAKNRTDIEFVFKLHPAYDYYGLYEFFLDPTIKNIYISHDKDLDKLLIGADGVVLMNYPSTGIISALLNFKAVIYYDKDVLKLPDWVSSLDYINILRSKTIKDIFVLIDKIIKKSVPEKSSELSKLLSFSNENESLINKELLGNFLVEPNINQQYNSVLKKRKSSYPRLEIIISFCNGLFMKPNLYKPFKLKNFYSYKLGNLFSRNKKINTINFLTLFFLTLLFCKNNKSRAFIFLNLLNFFELLKNKIIQKNIS